MRLRTLALFPFLYAIAFVIIALALGADSRFEFVIGQRMLARALAVVGCFWAASVFGTGDRLRLGWSLLGVSTLVVLVRDGLRLTERFAANAPDGGGLLMPLLVLASNILGPTGIFLLARSWRVASTMGAERRRGTVLITVLAAVLAILVAGPTARDSWRNLTGGETQQLAQLASAVADIISLTLIAPLFLIARQMRGGTLSWPWGLLTAHLVCWLLFDAASLFGARLTPGFPILEVFRGMALNFLFGAGVAQAMAVRSVTTSFRQRRDA